MLDHAGSGQPEIPTWWPFSKMAAIGILIKFDRVVQNVSVIYYVLDHAS